jgi:hypothetical protein
MPVVLVDGAADEQVMMVEAASSISMRTSVETQDPVISVLCLGLALVKVGDLNHETDPRSDSVPMHAEISFKGLI